MSLLYLSRVLPKDFTLQDIFWLAKRREITYDEITGEDLIKDILTGYKQSWKFNSPCEGIMVTSVQKKTLSIDYLVGKNLLRNAAGIYKDFEHLMQTANCTSIVGQTKSKGLLKLYAAFGFEQSAICVRKNYGW